MTVRLIDRATSSHDPRRDLEPEAADTDKRQAAARGTGTAAHATVRDAAPPAPPPLSAPAAVGAPPPSYVDGGAVTIRLPEALLGDGPRHALLIAQLDEGGRAVAVHRTEPELAPPLLEAAMLALDEMRFDSSAPGPDLAAPKARVELNFEAVESSTR